MSFICQLCHLPQPNGSSPVRIVIETREKEYINLHGFETIGTEIVREKIACRSCEGGATDDVA